MKKSCDAKEGVWTKSEGSSQITYRCVEPKEPDEDDTTTPSWLEKTFSELQDCSKRSDISGVAFCMIQIEAFYLTGIGILAIGIAGQIFNRRSSGYYGV